jgi:hypothetical protein
MALPAHENEIGDAVRSGLDGADKGGFGGCFVQCNGCARAIERSLLLPARPQKAQALEQEAGRLRRAPEKSIADREVPRPTDGSGKPFVGRLVLRNRQNEVTEENDPLPGVWLPAEIAEAARP